MLFRLQRLILLVEWLLTGDSSMYAQCGKKRPSDQFWSGILPGYDRGIRLQRFGEPFQGARRYELWWLAGSNDDEGHTALVLADLAEQDVFLVDTVEQIYALGADAHLMIQGMRNQLNEQLPYFQRMQEACLGGQHVLDGLEFMEMSLRPKDPSNHIRDTLDGLPAGSVVKIVWKSEDAPGSQGRFRMIPEPTRTAVRILSVMTGLSFPDKGESIKCLVTGVCLKESQTSTMIQLEEGFDVEQFVALGEQVESVHII